MFLPWEAHTCSNGYHNLSASGKAPAEDGGHPHINNSNKKNKSGVSWSQRLSLPEYMYDSNCRVMHVITNNGYQCLYMDGSFACMISAKLKYLKICVIDALKDKRWCSGLQREDNTSLNWGEQQVGGDHYHCMNTHRHTVKSMARLLLLACRRAAKWPPNQTHHWIFDRVNQADDVGSPTQVFKYLYFPFDLLLLDGLKEKYLTD